MLGWLYEEAPIVVVDAIEFFSYLIFYGKTIYLLQDEKARTLLFSMACSKEDMLLFIDGERYTIFLVALYFIILIVFIKY